MKRLERKVAEREVQYPNEGWFKWEPTAEDMSSPQFYDVPEGSEEYNQVEQLMRDETGLGATKNVWHRVITKIERVVNPALWDNYYFTRQALKKKPRNKGSANELWVKHGTGKTDGRLICRGEVGIDKNYSRETNNMFGKATYTAENAKYCDQKNYCYDCPTTGTRQMLLCRFAAGTIAQMTDGTYDSTDSAEGKVHTRNLIKPPDHHDSVRGDVVPGSGFFALMSYRDYQIYPAYLVSFLAK